jgi:hypothetical protein
MLTVGLSGRLPFVGGGKVSVGASFHEGKFDAGVVVEADLPVVHAGKMLGKVATEFTYSAGDFDSVRGKIDYSGQVHYKLIGASVSGDPQTKEFSSASIAIGPGLGASVGAVKTGTYSIRQIVREVVVPLSEKVKSWW